MCRDELSSICTICHRYAIHQIEDSEAVVVMDAAPLFLPRFFTFSRHTFLPFRHRVSLERAAAVASSQLLVKSWFGDKWSQLSLFLPPTLPGTFSESRLQSSVLCRHLPEMLPR